MPILSGKGWRKVITMDASIGQVTNLLRERPVSWPKTMAATVDEFIAAHKLGDRTEDEPCECRACGDHYSLSDGEEPSALCNECAHKAGDLLIAEVERLRA